MRPDICTCLQPGFYFAPTTFLEDQTLAADGSYELAMTNLSIPVAGIVYVNMTASDCKPTPYYPSGVRSSQGLLWICTCKQHTSSVNGSLLAACCRRL